ncbi:MAG TPA: hypothetical protein VEU47_18285 [Candidatus Cybelea sp.]|nr:hypothetical protein [Candidatus Cybelea sp.]
MPGRDEIVRSVYGAWRLAHLDASGMIHFNQTIEGFYRSFAAAVLVAPLYFIQVLVQWDSDAAHAVANGQTPDSMGQSLTLEFATYAIGWLMYPALVALISRPLALNQRYVPYIIAYNWSQAIIIVFWLPLTAAIQTSPVEGIAPMLWLAGFLATNGYMWFVARAALQTSSITALALVFIDVLSGVALHTALARVL